MGERILIIDDDIRLSEMVSVHLSRAGFTVEARATGQAGLETVLSPGTRAERFDLVILDVMLPDIDGLEVCRRIREKSDVAIIMLTARGEEVDRVVGLELGADDYLSKPFSTRELEARLKAILRRGARSAGALSLLQFGRLEIDVGARSVRVDGQERTLTAYQFDLLLALARKAGRVMSREQLMELCKGEDLEAFDRSIDVHISRIRAAIEDAPATPRRIITVRGAGYVFARNQDQA